MDNFDHNYHLKKFRNLLKDVLPTNSFYAEKMASVGIKSYRDIKTWKDFTKVPFTTKDDLRTDQLLNHPYGTNISRKLKDYNFLTFTSGTSGKKRMNTVYTKRDYKEAVNQEIIWLGLMGVTKRDKVMYILPFVLSKLLSEATMKIGAMVLPSDSRTQVDLLTNMLDLQPTVLETSPTVILNLINLADQQHINLRKINLQKIILTGEPGTNDIRSLVEDKFDCDCFDALGSTELSIYSFDCRNKKGPHLIEENTVFEILDPKTGKVSDTGKGELVGTTLWRHDFPFIRYRTGDFVNLVKIPCSCGWHGKSLKGGIYYRIDGAIKINETDFYPDDIERHVKKIIGPHEFLITLKEVRGLDIVTIYIELGLKIDPKWYLSLKGKIADIIGVRPKIVVLNRGTLQRTSWKSIRFIELKPKDKNSSYNLGSWKTILFFVTFNAIIFLRSVLRKMK